MHPIDQPDVSSFFTSPTPQPSTPSLKHSDISSRHMYPTLRMEIYRNVGAFLDLIQKTGIDSVLVSAGALECLNACLIMNASQLEEMVLKYA